MTDRNVDIVGGTGKTPSSLLQRVKSMEHEAWNRLVHLYSPLVFSWCRKSSLQDADAEDIHQEVFRSVHRAIKSFRPEPGGTFRAWLRTITTNKILDFHRRKKTGEWIHLDPSTIAALDPSEDSESEPTEQRLLFRRAVEMVLSEVPDLTREAFLRVTAQNQDPADVARDLGLSLNSVYLARSRLSKRIREEFGELVQISDNRNASGS